MHILNHKRFSNPKKLAIYRVDRIALIIFNREIFTNRDQVLPHLVVCHGHPPNQPAFVFPTDTSGTTHDRLSPLAPASNNRATARAAVERAAAGT
jgi:hypothetical protein